jgi:hypothetical protein
MCEEKLAKKLAKLERFWSQFLNKELSSENITLKKFNEAVQRLKGFFEIANFANSEPECTNIVVKQEQL